MLIKLNLRLLNIGQLSILNITIARIFVVIYGTF
jgi:hypothetical protein